MGQRYKTPDGHVYEEQNGQYVLVDDTPSTQPGLVTKSADPSLALDRAIKAAALAKAARDAANAPVETRKTVAEADRAEAEAAAARLKAGQAADPARAAAMNDLNQDSTFRAIQQAEGDLKNGHATGLWSWLKPIPGTNAQLLGSDLSTINAQNMLGKLAELKTQSATGASGMGQLSDTEGRILRDSIANLDQSLPEDRLKANLQFIEQHYRRAAAITHGLDPDKVDLTQRQAITPSTGAPVALSTNGMQSVEDPTLKALARHIGSMMAQGVPDEDIKSYMQRAGVNPADTNIDGALAFRKSREFEAWQRQNPGRAYPVGRSFYMKDVPLSTARSLLNTAAQSDAGAYFINAGEGVTGNRLNRLGGNPDQIAAAEALIRAEHPKASLAGTITGQILDDVALKRIPGLEPLMATRWGRRGADAAYGAFAGSGAAGDDSLTAPIIGAVTNAAGGSLGRGAQRATGTVVAGIRDPALRYLNDAGVPLTIGQMARPGSDVTGRIVAGLEDRMASIPGPGDFVKAARLRGQVGLNRAGYNEGLAPIGGNIGDKTGAEAVDSMQNQVSDAYTKALGGVNVPQDAQFAAEYAAARNAASQIPVHGPGLVHTLDTAVAPYLKGGSLSGDDLQAALQTIRKESAAYDGQPGGTSATNALGQVENSLTGLVERQAPEVMPALNDANAAYRNQQILQNATNGQGSELFTGAGLRRSAINNTKNYGGVNTASGTDRPFYDLAKSAIDVMHSAIPDSGTAGRYMLPMVAGSMIGGGTGFADAEKGRGVEGGLSGAAKGLAVAAALSTPYTSGGQKAIQALLMGQRMKELVAAGELLKKYPQYVGGSTGAAIGRDWALDPYAQPLGDPPQ